MVSRIIATFIGLTALWAQAASGLEVVATVDKNPVMMDEAITLSIVATGDVDRGAYDSSVLLGDFIVGNTSVSSQTRMVNFDTTKTTTWQTTLFPKKEGKFTIPPISIEGQRTDPITINVVPVPDITTNEQRDFYVTAEISQPTVYVQQHVNYVVRLHMAANIERGSLQAPAIESATVEQIGEDKQYSDIVNGKRFQIIERNFVIVPEKSGEFVIQAPIFSGEVIARNTRQSFGFFNRTQNVTRRGPQLTLNVKPIPENYAGDWLPSEFVELNEEWSNDGEFVVGEPITRTVTLTVAGQNKEQLPEINQLYPPYIKHYPDQPSTASAQKDGMVISQRTESTAVIPSEPGSLVIPGVDVTWFNTRTNKVETVSIPAKSYTVKPAAIEPSAAPQQVVAPISALQTPETNEMALSTEPNYLWQGVSAGLLTAWIITLFAWLRARKQSPIELAKPNNIEREKHLSTKQVIKCIEQNNPAQIQPALLQWLRDTDGKRYASLPEALSYSINDELRLALSAYLSGFYGADKTKPETAQLVRAVAHKSKQKSDANKEHSALTPLYKN
jgi:hypothetical protein